MKNEKIPDEVLRNYLGSHVQVFYADTIRGECMHAYGHLTWSDGSKRFLLNYAPFNEHAVELRVAGVGGFTVWTATEDAPTISHPMLSRNFWNSR